MQWADWKYTKMLYWAGAPPQNHHYSLFCRINQNLNFVPVVYWTHTPTTVQAWSILCAEMDIGEGLYNHCDQFPVDKLRGKWNQPWIKILVIRKWFSPWFEQRNWFFSFNEVFNCHMSIRHIRHVLVIIYIVLPWCNFHVLRYLEVSKNISFTMKVPIVMVGAVAIVTQLLAP